MVLLHTPSLSLASQQYTIVNERSRRRERKVKRPLWLEHTSGLNNNCWKLKNWFTKWYKRMMSEIKTGVFQTRSSRVSGGGPNTFSKTCLFKCALSKHTAGLWNHHLTFYEGWPTNAELCRLQDKFSQRKNKNTKCHERKGDIRAHKTTTETNISQPTSCLFEPYIINKPQVMENATY